ncbi:MAG: hypothetical protein E6Q98_15720 [Rhodospirillaceae bacterium]|nr:MAG: hypothetical protein E6Q98_15720 [Rhodospirillaceae bacterium]
MKTYVFHRGGGFYMLDLEIPADMSEEQMIRDHAECNPGTLRVECPDHAGVRVIWEKTPVC